MKGLAKPFEIVTLGDIRVHSVPGREHPSDNLKRAVIEQVWQEIQSEHEGRFFNGSCLNFIDLLPDRDCTVVEGEFVEYKEFLVHQKRKDLNLNVRPVAVSGLTIISEGDADYVIFAQRTSSVTEYQGLIELVPSGGITSDCLDDKGTVNYRLQLLKELQEETGISGSEETEMQTLALIKDTCHNVFDIGCMIKVSAAREWVREKMSGLTEYKQPYFVELSSLESFVQKNPNSIVPTSLALIQAFKEFYRK